MASINGQRSPLLPDSEELREVAMATVRCARPWAVALARFGYVAKAIVYLALGALLLAVAQGRDRDVTDTAGALWAIAQRPLGRTAIFAIAVGLAAHSVLRLVQAIVDPEARERSTIVVLLRIGEGLAGVGHALLALGAFQLFAGTGGPATGDVRAVAWARGLLAMPYGDAWLGALALVILLFGVSLLARGLVLRGVCSGLDLSRVPWVGCHTVGLVIRCGLITQGTLFTTIGWLGMRAALDRQPREAQGPAGAVRWLVSGHAYGDLVLYAFALGMAAVALSCYFDAIWRRYPR